MAITSLADLQDIARDLWGEIERDRVLAVAAGVTFYALLAVVPAITALISILVVSRMLWKFPGGMLRACEGSCSQAARSRGIGWMG